MLTNKTNIPLAVAVWLAGGDTYDLVYDPGVVSATSLLKPIRSQVLIRRMLKSVAEGTISADQLQALDISELTPSRLGTAIHTAIEVAWTTCWEAALRILGYPDGVIKKVRINPETPDPTGLNIYVERRTTRELGGYTVSGKFDLVINGTVEDLKTTRTYNWINGSNNAKYARQGSIYRWLNPDIITSDIMNVHFIFTDWSPSKATGDPSYPAQRIMSKQLPLMSIAHTQSFIYERLTQLASLEDTPQEYLPRCTPTELWQEPSKWAYYKNPQNIVRATKLFDNHQDAMVYQAQQGGTGLIMERAGEPKFCNYCEARYLCTQAKEYVSAGLLFL